MGDDDRRERVEASGGDGGGGREGAAAGSRNSKPAAVGRVPLYRLFAFADRTDALLMAVGAVMAVANGMAQPIMTFIFGDVIDAFGSSASPDVLHRVVKVRATFNSYTSYSVAING
jgi:ATP-binding cassette subfamily B (MDR/TAP) protein 1